MDELSWMAGQMVTDIALVVITVVAVGLTVVLAAYVLVLTIVLARSKRWPEKR